MPIEPDLPDPSAHHGSAAASLQVINLNGISLVQDIWVVRAIIEEHSEWLHWN